MKKIRKFCKYEVFLEHFNWNLTYHNKNADYLRWKDIAAHPKPWEVNFIVTYSCGMRFWQKYTCGVLCGLKVCGWANFPKFFLQSVFVKILNSLQFQKIGLTQAIRLLTSQTWLTKTFLKCKKASKKNIML